MKRIIILLVMTLLFTFPKAAFATFDPLSVPNNKFGIHILFPDELNEASKLVNSNGGDWGYVVIPIQAGDKDLIKWQTFMDKAKTLHLIPILRLATEGNYFNTKVWRKPTPADVLDFANFLDSLDWPTKNRYVVIFNEVNRGDEWGGNLNPAEYADMLYYSTIVFKNKNQDFFIISAGLDNSAPNSGKDYMNEYQYITDMHDFLPDLFTKIDGMASHAYPNPGFSQSPLNQTKSSIASFRYERDLLESFANKKLPVFITETGWSKNGVPDVLSASYYSIAFLSVWNDPSIVAVTPFLLRADGGSFSQFSFLNNGNPTLFYNTIALFPKTKGNPVISGELKDEVKHTKGEILGEQTLRDFSSENKIVLASVFLPDSIKILFKWILKL